MRLLTGIILSGLAQSLLPLSFLASASPVVDVGRHVTPALVEKAALAEAFSGLSGDNHVAVRDVSLPDTAEHSISVSKALAVRDTRRDLAVVDKRGIFSWAASIFKYSPFAFMATPFLIATCVVSFKDGGSVAGLGVCITGAALTLVGAAYEIYSKIAEGAAAVNNVMELTGSAFDIGDDFLIMDRDVSEDSPHEKLRKQLAATNLTLYHSQDGRTANLAELFMANTSNPISVYHHGTNVTLRMWTTLENSNRSSTKRDASTNSTTTVNSTMIRVHSMVKLASNLTIGSPFNLTGKLPATLPGMTYTPPGSSLSTRQTYIYDQGLGDDEEYIEESGTGTPSGDPNYAYYGFDCYGSSGDINEFNDDLGVGYIDSNGFSDSMVQMGSDVYMAQAWDTCVCQETNTNDWVSTGSMQLSWDATYNGYSECWNTNCDGA